MLNRPALVLAAGLLLAGSAFAADTPSHQIVIQNQAFTPNQLTVPANTKIELIVVNKDALPAEFESYDLSREVIVPGHSQIKVYIGPLDAGKYQFFNDFHQQSVGWIVAATPANAG